MNKKDNYFSFYKNRVMISLGPLNDNRYCPFECLFCYVKGGFSKYEVLTDDEIINFLKEHRNLYKIVYISGDTDSFAFPRTNRAINLLERIVIEIGVDVLFTTRAVFAKDHLKQLKEINGLYNSRGYKLYSCISIPRLFSCDYLESKNTPSPHDRIECLKQLYNIGLITILAMRPFLPVIKTEEYKKLIDLCSPYSYAILGESWYANENMIKDVCRDCASIKLEKKKMDFDKNELDWYCYNPIDIIDELTTYCISNNNRLFMRSEQALDYIRTRNKGKI